MIYKAHKPFPLGPPAAPAGAYVQTASVTPNSVRLIWTVTQYMEHGSPITQYDIEAEVEYYPGQWKLVATGTHGKANNFELTKVKVY